MTTVEILFSYTTPPTESVASALGSTKDVYGIRRLSLDGAARTLSVEYAASPEIASKLTELDKLKR